MLYIPSYVCNIVGSPIFEIAAQISFGRTEKSMGGMSDANGKPVAYFSPATEPMLSCLKLSGPPVGPRLGPSKFESDTAYMLSITWPDSERARWEARGQQVKTDTEKRQWIGEQPYTAEEKEWLKKHYGGEFKFLMSYQLSIYDEEDRAEGRAIMRAMARADESNDEDDEEDEEEDDDQKGEDEDEAEEDSSDPDNHLADYHFSEEELNWIKKHYRDSATFMFSYGLKFYDDEDCAEAKRLVRALLHE